MVVTLNVFDWPSSSTALPPLLLAFTSPRPIVAAVIALVWASTMLEVPAIAVLPEPRLRPTRKVPVGFV